MKLSVVIVNYNVKHFLEQCLVSVRKAVRDIDAEIVVVDNSSVDGSVRMLKEKFPEVKLIDNKQNLGFSKANNQAIRQTEAEYVLLLNPDTVVEDDTLTKVVQFMDDHPDAGGLGVKMVDGTGKFLPESKRGLPTPETSFYKMFGISGLFPRSKRFARYHLGYLDENEIHEVEILAGAFMLLRKSLLDEIGLLDETFFMYGEDIDLSYRILKAGYKNYYYPKTRIIHYKGESTKKGSVNYVFVFYNAMIIFAKKHFSQKNAKTFTFLINLAIYARATLAILSRFFRTAVYWILDAIILYLGIYLFGEYWSVLIFNAESHYPPIFMQLVVPLYLLIWLVSVYITGGYDKPILIPKVVKGIFWGTVFILVFYALLPEHMRYSRAIILFGSVWGLTGMMLVRMLLGSIGFTKMKWNETESRRFIIIGELNEALRVERVLKSTSIKPGYIGLVSSSESLEKDEQFIGTIRQIRDIITIYKIDEVIFCSKNVPHEIIINKMSELSDQEVAYKILN